MEFVQAWMRVEHYVGEERVLLGYTETLDGAVSPSTGMIMSMQHAMTLPGLKASL